MIQPSCHPRRRVSSFLTFLLITAGLVAYRGGFAPLGKGQATSGGSGFRIGGFRTSGDVIRRVLNSALSDLLSGASATGKPAVIGPCRRRSMLPIPT